MLSELKAAKTDLNIEILGVNWEMSASYNDSVTSVSSLPWLQDTPEGAAWNRWKVEYRDVYILDSQNRLFAVFNLTDNDLYYPENRETLKQLFLSAAAVVDSDGDQLPDEWENRYFGTINGFSDADPDGDGNTNFSELAFGSDPSNGQAFQAVRPSLKLDGPQPEFTVTFRRLAGSLLDYIVETSTDLQHWSASTTEITVKQPPRNLFDGTGTAEVIYALKKPVTPGQLGFVRVRALPRQRP